MDNTRIVISALWVALMLTYLLGDVLRIFSGDFKAGEVAGMQATPVMYLGLAILMLIPIVMLLLSVTLKLPVIRWVNIVAAILLFGFNLIGLPTYPSAYDKFLIAVGLVFNVLTLWYAWRWAWRATFAQARRLVKAVGHSRFGPPDVLLSTPFRGMSLCRAE